MLPEPWRRDSLRVGRLTPPVMAVLEEWSSPPRLASAPPGRGAFGERRRDRIRLPASLRLFPTSRVDDPLSPAGGRRERARGRGRRVGAAGPGPRDPRVQASL